MPEFVSPCSVYLGITFTKDIALIIFTKYTLRIEYLITNIGFMLMPVSTKMPKTHQSILPENYTLLCSKAILVIFNSVWKSTNFNGPPLCYLSNLLPVTSIYFVTLFFFLSRFHPELILLDTSLWGPDLACFWSS